jgi:hypothetical protein
MDKLCLSLSCEPTNIYRVALFSIYINIPLAYKWILNKNLASQIWYTNPPGEHILK